jgi:hypothetical protein
MLRISAVEKIAPGSEAAVEFGNGPAHAKNPLSRAPPTNQPSHLFPSVAIPPSAGNLQYNLSNFMIVATADPGGATLLEQRRAGLRLAAGETT